MTEFAAIVGHFQFHNGAYHWMSYEHQFLTNYMLRIPVPEEAQKKAAIILELEEKNLIREGHGWPKSMSSTDTS